MGGCGEWGFEDFFGEGVGGNIEPSMSRSLGTGKGDEKG